MKEQKALLFLSSDFFFCKNKFRLVRACNMPGKNVEVIGILNPNYLLTFLKLGIYFHENQAGRTAPLEGPSRFSLAGRPTALKDS